jgi:hypothetical protein
VSPELRIEVLERYQGCTYERTRSLNVWGPCDGPLTLDHVQDGYGRMGKRAPSDRQHLVTLCRHHHLDGFATSHRPELREYLATVEPQGAVE